VSVAERDISDGKSRLWKVYYCRSCWWSAWLDSRWCRWVLRTSLEDVSCQQGSYQLSLRLFIF